MQSPNPIFIQFLGEKLCTSLRVFVRSDKPKPAKKAKVNLNYCRTAEELRRHGRECAFGFSGIKKVRIFRRRHMMQCGKRSPK